MCPKRSRSAVFQICTRQLVLSSSIALDTFRLIPKIAGQIKDEKLLENVLNLAVEIAQRSAKHSAEFLEHTPAVAGDLTGLVMKRRQVADSVFGLAAQFANRTGGMTADLWAESAGVTCKIDRAKCDPLDAAVR